MKQIAVLFTGGTIGSRRLDEHRVNLGTAPYTLLTQHEEECPQSGVTFLTGEPLHLLSENMHPQHWVAMERAVRTLPLDTLSGVVLTHGTDTLAYSAAALSLLLSDLSIPVLLVGIIESAIMINMGIPYFSGTALPFVASIVVGTIQLGATVDYAILMTNRFREELINGRTARDAARIAMEQCSQSILTSGLTFFVATASVALISRMELISSLCRLISRGALISMAVILLVLPALLIITAPVIRKTTYHWLVKKERA